MEIKIRKITLADVRTLSVIAKQSFYDTFTGTCTEADLQSFLETYFNEDRLSEEIRDEDHFCFFAETAGIPAGFLQFKEDYSSLSLMKKWKALELKRIYVLKEFHGMGIAQKLMEYILDFARNEKYEMVWLGVWEHNDRAKKFYEKYGFTFSGHTHPFPIGNTPQTDQWLWKFL